MKLLVYDIGGTFVKWAILTKELEIEERGSFVTFEDDTDEKCKNLYKRIVKHINELKERVTIAKVGVSSACVIDSKTGLVVGGNPVFKGYVGINIYETIKEGTGLDCVAMNDGNSGALGEYVKGSITDVHSAVMIVLGTGVGSGIIYNGKVFDGFKYWAGEVGSFNVKDKTWEDWASVSALCRFATKAIGKEVDGRWIFDNLEDEVVAKIYKEWLDNLAIGITNIFHAIGPEVILIGGGISSNEKLLIEDIMQAIKPLVNNEVYNAIQLRKASLGNDANIYGVASLL